MIFREHITAEVPRTSTFHVLGRIEVRGEEDRQTRSFPRHVNYGIADGPYLVATLGEVPNKGRALSELRRVLRRGGQLAVGEVLLDPHRVSLGELRSLAAAAGLEHQRTFKGIFGYYAAFRAS